MAITNERCLEIVDYYKSFLEREFPEIKPDRDSNDGVAHVKAMLPLMEDFLKEARREKFMRWLGFVQGWLWSYGLFGINEMGKHNKFGPLSPDEDM